MIPLINFCYLMFEEENNFHISILDESGRYALILLWKQSSEYKKKQFHLGHTNHTLFCNTPFNDL